MKLGRLQWRTKRARIIILVMLTCAILWLSISTSAIQRESAQSTTSLAASPLTQSASSRSQSTGARPAPDVIPLPFLRLVVVLMAGLVISGARLARKFRRFWGLGVFTNPYAVLFLLFGVGVCGIPVTSESFLSSRLGSLGAWIADLSGIFVALVLPAIGLKQHGVPAGESLVRDLEDTLSANPIIAVIEDAIRDRILIRMQSEVVAASHRYDWDTIKLAAHRTLEEEMTIGRLGHEDGEAARQSIESLQAHADSRVDSRNKYEALLRLLRWCSFSRLRDGLAAAVRETQP